MFPHHENERAISIAGSRSSLARYWVHHALVTSDNRKLSRSSGAPYLIRDLCRTYHGEAIRLFILTTHYCRSLDFTFKRLNQASAALERLYGLVHRWASRAKDLENQVDMQHPLVASFCRAMDHDLNIPEGINIIFSAARRLNKVLNEARETGAVQPTDLKELGMLVMICKDILCILNDQPEDFFEKSMFRLHTRSTNKNISAGG
jgi:cysteinyl-tRNA synthetase